MWKYVILIVILFSLFGCDDRTLDPADAKHAWLHVLYTDNLFYEEVLDASDDNQTYIINLPDNSQLTLDKFVKIHYGSLAEPEEEETLRTYITWAKRADYYTQYTSGSYLDTLLINASSGFTPVVPGEVCGTIYTTAHIPFTNYEFYILQDSVIVDSFTTSSSGYFNIDTPFGDYQICESYIFDPLFYADFNIDSFYDDYIIMCVSYEEKPNIYIYPEEKIDLDVSIIFPHGGNVTTSIPKYGDSWKNLSVEPSGKINNEFDYLFYESQNPDLFQYDKGWIISKENLEFFFVKNLKETGFAGQEITDFIDYWIPLLIDHSYYAIYPQYNEKLSEMVDLEFSIKPDNLLRLIYSIEGQHDSTLIIQEPTIPEFKREGFFVVEWGVSLRSQTKLSMNK